MADIAHGAWCPARPVRPDGCYKRRDSHRQVARVVLGTTPHAQCRPFPNEAESEANGRGETWGAYLAEVLPSGKQSANVDIPLRLRAMCERFPHLSVCSNDVIRELLRTAHD